MTDRALLQQALEALQAYGAHTPNCDHLMLLLSLPPQRKPCSCGLVATMQALRERLAQPEQNAVLAEREACANIDWTPILRNNGMVTWGDAETLADLVSTAIRERGNT